MVVPGLDGMWHLGCHFLPSCPSPCGDPQSGGVLVLSFSARTEGPWLPPEKFLPEHFAGRTFPLSSSPQGKERELTRLLLFSQGG